MQSPVAAEVSSIYVSQGEVVDPNIPLMTLIPVNSQLEVKLFAPTRAIGFVKEGAKVKIRLDAFPYQKYGLLDGVVTEVPHNILQPNEIKYPIRYDEPVYQITVQLPQQYIQAYGKEIPLQSGMKLEADILLDKKHLLDWVLDPLYSIKGRL